MNPESTPSAAYTIPPPRRAPDRRREGVINRFPSSTRSGVTVGFRVENKIPRGDKIDRARYFQFNLYNGERVNFINYTLAAHTVPENDFCNLICTRNRDYISKEAGFYVISFRQIGNRRSSLHLRKYNGLKESISDPGGIYPDFSVLVRAFPARFQSPPSRSGGSKVESRRSRLFTIVFDVVRPTIRSYRRFGFFRRVSR